MRPRIETLSGFDDPILAYVRSGWEQGLQHAVSREGKRALPPSIFIPRWYTVCTQRAERADHDRSDRTVLADLDYIPAPHF
jgi:hypothetical protein